MLYLQRGKLDEQFDELFKDASLDFKKRLEADLSDSLANENSSRSEIDGQDDDVILAEYHSEDEGLNEKAESEDEDEEEHITKVHLDSFQATKPYSSQP